MGLELEDDDDGSPVSITLDVAARLVMDNLRRNGPETDEDRPWISHVAADGQDRGERIIYFDVTHPSGLCEGFSISLTREPI